MSRMMAGSVSFPDGVPKKNGNGGEDGDLPLSLTPGGQSQTTPVHCNSA